jgi:CheY-like chemotaxis protein
VTNETKPKILVVDDDRTTVDLMAAFLRQGGYDVTAAFDAMQGFSVANRLPPPALIVLDVNMPAGGGLRVLERLNTSSHTAGIPVLVVSANTDPKLSDTLRAKGAREILAKPVDRPTLLDAVARLLGAAPSA